MTTIWRFESNGYDASRLFAIDFTDPVNPQEDTEPEPARSTSHEQMVELASMVDVIKDKTGYPEVALVAHSRGGNAVRNYLRNMQGARICKAAVLAASPCHGVYGTAYHVENEYNSRSRFLRQLNTPGEVVAGVRVLTLRSDGNDMYYQPEGTLIGMPGPTNIGHDSPELQGGKNVTLHGLDHRECAFHPFAFREIYDFVVGHAPARLDIVAEKQPIISGRITGYARGAPTNRPLRGATLEIFQLTSDTAERRRPSRYREVTDDSGAWGPFEADARTYYEFVIEAEGHWTTHIYRPPFLRSSSLVHFRPVPIGAERQGCIVILTRARGLLAAGRDKILVNGATPSGIRAGIPSMSAIRLRSDLESSMPISILCNDEKLTVRPWPLDENHIVVAEMQQ
jgi:pimeloyl-ACP methyl ester carboxylesterase